MIDRRKMSNLLYIAKIHSILTTAVTIMISGYV
jgi:hypothetical protein